MKPLLIVALISSLSCLPISSERNHPLDGYNYNQYDPQHIDAVDDLVCAAAGAEKTRCWGSLGAPWRTYELPFSINQSEGIEQIAVTGTTICGLRVDGQVLCAGQSPNGVFGHNDTQEAATLLVSGEFRTIKSSSTKTCAQQRDDTGFGTLTCWGDTSYQVFPGQNDANDRTPFELQLELNDQPISVQSFDVGDDHICAVTLNPSKVICWGRQTTQADPFPTEPRVILDIPNDGQLNPDSLCVGRQHACVILKTGENDRPQVQCWGDNSFGQIQPNNPGGNLSPKVINLAMVPDKVFCADNHTCAIDSDGRHPVCWGDNSYGQLGGEPNESGIAKVEILPNLQWVQFTGGKTFSCARISVSVGGYTYCWGDNSHGQLGNPTITDTSERAAVVDFFHDAIND